MRHFPLAALCVCLLTGCGSGYSPNTYSSNAVQLANKVEAGTVVGFREVAITASGNIGAITGGAAGGVLGAQYADSALVAVGTSAVGLMVGSALDRAAGDTTGWEYIIRKGNGDLLSVTQRQRYPLELGQKVLVIMGPQARVVPDYSVIPEQTSASVENKPVAAESKPPPPVKVEVVLSLAPGLAAQLPSGQTIAAQSQAPDVVAVEAVPPPPAPTTDGDAYKFISAAPLEVQPDAGSQKTD
jgi:outer membrane lipoprotein SlyB